MSAESRVRRLLALAERIADPVTSLGKRTREQMGAALPLSRQGIELALSQHLERQISDHEIRQFVADAKPAARCHVLLSANVCTGALRALAWALAASPQVLLRPSSRDPVLARVLASEMPGIELVDHLQPRAGDCVHLYGSDATLEKVAKEFEPEVDVYCHGSGFGVAVVTEDCSRPAPRLAEDLVPFDGRGCLSPRWVFVLNRPNFAAELHRTLQLWDLRVPRARLADDEKRELATWSQTMRAIGDLWSGQGHAVSCEQLPPRLTLPPAHRCISVVEINGWDDCVRLLQPWRRFLTCLAGEPSQTKGIADRLGLAALRFPALGQMQRPDFDGPVDLRRRLGALLRG